MPNQIVQVQLLVWIFIMRVMMIVASALSYFVNDAIAEGAVQETSMNMNFDVRRWCGSRRSFRW